MLDGKILYYKKVNVSIYIEGERWKDRDRQIDRFDIVVEMI